MFRFANPHLLWLLVAVPVMIVAFAVILQLRKRNLRHFGNIATVKSLLRDVSSWRVHTKFILFSLAYTALVFAAARPQFGAKLREEKHEGVEMMFVVDVSNSMLAEDFEPSRLERTKYAIDKLFEGLNQERVGVIVFAGEAKVQLPITTDYRMARSFAKRLSPELVSVQGTDISDAIDLASLSYSQREGASRVMILITDGEAHDSDALAAAERAAERGVRIFTIGIGSPEGAPVKVNGEFIKDENGEMVVSKLGEQMLEQIAATTSAAYVRATKQSIGLEEIVKSINAMERTELTTMRYEEYNEQYQYLLGAALLLLLFDSLILSRRNPRLRKLNIFREQP